MIDAFLRHLESVFGWLLEASWQASVLVVLVLILQVVLRGRLNPRWHHALWLLVILRLLLPVLPESTFSLFQFTPTASPAIERSVTEPIFVASSVPPVTLSAPSLPPPAPTYPFSFYTLFALVWMVGVFALLVFTWQVNRRFARYVASAPPIDDPRLLEIAAIAQAELRVRRPLRMIESAQVQGPAIMGLIRPTLILPERVRAQFSDNELRFIFLHEFAHLKRGDLAVQWLIALLQILHWFNPVLWYSFRRMRADREPATDALVLSRTGEAEKENYGLVLVKLLEHFHQRHSLPTLVGILEDKEQFKHRFSLIGKFTRGAYGWSLLGVIIVAALAIAGLTRSEHAAFKRDPALPYAIDLKPFDSWVFHDPAGSDSRYLGYAGHKVIDGLPFDVDGQIELYGKENADRDKNYPDAISGIRIDRKFDELHLVHAVEWREYYGCPVAIVRLHYAEGTTVDLPIRFDFQVNDWNRLYTEDAEIVADPDTKIIWRGAGVAEGTGRLFESMLRNPFPDRKVDTMEIVSTHSGCSYVLVAATVAQAEPQREVTAPMPLLPARHFLGHLTVRVVDKKTGAPLAGAEIYPAMITGDISLVADNLVTAKDGTAVVNYPTGAESVPAGSGDASDPQYPKGGAKDLRLKVTKAGYADCEINWQNGWDAAEVPEEITYRLTPVGDTTLGNIPDFTIRPSNPPMLLDAVKQGDSSRNVGTASPAPSPESSSAKTGDVDPDGWTIHDLKVSDLPLTELAQKLTAMTKADDPKGVGVAIDVKIPPGEEPLRITYGYPPYTGDLRNLLYHLADLYSIRYEFKIASRDPDSQTAPITITQFPAAEARFNKKAGQTKIDLNIDDADLSTALKSIQSKAAAKGFSFDLNTDALAAQSPPHVSLQAPGWSIEHAIISLCYLADLVPQPLENFTGYRLVPGAATELHDRTRIRFGIATSFLKVDDAKDNSGVWTALSGPGGVKRTWGPATIMPAYSSTYRGKEISPSGSTMRMQFCYHHKQGDPPGFVVPVEDAPHLEVKYKTFVSDKTHIRTDITLRLEKPDGSIMNEWTGSTIAPSGAILDLVVHGSPIQLDTPGEAGTESNLYVFAQADYVDNNQRETDIETQPLELVSPANVIQQIELTETPVKSASVSTPN